MKPTQGANPAANQGAVGFSALLHLVKERAQKGSLTFGELLTVVGPKGHVFLILFLVLPFVQPFPLPGISAAFGSVIALIGLFVILNRPPWLPERFARIELRADIVEKICRGLELALLKLERFIKPRGRNVCSNLWFRRINGLWIVFHALLLSLPLPIPFSNFLPAFTIFLIALGSLEEDLVTVLAGYVAALVTFAFFVALIVIPYLSLSWYNGTTGP